MDLSIVKPFTNQFSQSQIQSILTAWLPTKISPYLTGILMVDMYAISVIATGLTTLAYLAYSLLIKLMVGKFNSKTLITLQIDHYSIGTYNERNKNIMHKALSWLISEQTKNYDKGSYILNIFNNINNKNINAIPHFNILPMNNHEIDITYKDVNFKIKYKIPENSNNTSIKNNGPCNYNVQYKPFDIEKPSIYLSVQESNTCVKDITTLLNDITLEYLEFIKNYNGHYKYENNQARWMQIHKLTSCRGLDSIALEEKNEKLLQKEIETFINNKLFYEKIGIPYRRGILLFGKPGTGKTSLINAISSYLSRDIYHLNIKMIKDDYELNTLFSSVPRFLRNSNCFFIQSSFDSNSSLPLTYPPVLISVKSQSFIINALLSAFFILSILIVHPQSDLIFYSKFQR
ncbi:hypothetical protein RCL_jg24354.t1 [Rhizophagus clarus]|uniref:ATPase AAA-type core domain-containing protein n=1 Tax=Rhizophagus clarus TaxID=94130 RepID=A0A8H3MJN3_9GLOM|nr:hypothetical protein RCL_jg24354.t1 [Rhizophagus clarus]